VLESLEGSVGKGCFGDSFHEGIVSLMAAEYLEYFLISTV
jgi:hypothetical protein